MSVADSRVFLAGSPEKTEHLGEALAGLVPPGAVVALIGDLASGKTCFVRGAARRFGVEHEVHSPTFTLVNQYGPGPDMIHLDLYRLEGIEEVLDLGYEELFSESAPCFVEWAERAEGLLPRERVVARFEVDGQTSRRITVENRGVLPRDWADRLAGALDSGG